MSEYLELLTCEVETIGTAARVRKLGEGDDSGDMRQSRRELARRLRAVSDAMDKHARELRSIREALHPGGQD